MKFNGLEALTGERAVRALAIVAAALLLALLSACDCGTIGGGRGDLGAQEVSVPDAPPRACVGGTDEDGDGYGVGCPLGPDCDDSNPNINPGATEVCNGKDDNCDGNIDEGVTNPCGTCGPGCTIIGDNPFVINPAQDPNVKDANGVGTDGNGDLVLDKTQKNFNYMWIANSLDTAGTGGGCALGHAAGYNSALDPRCRGTISKIDTVNMKEVARYFTVTCHSQPNAAGCVDLHGQPIDAEFPHAPSRTAVDYNFDVWVANRAFGGQPSASKIANELTDCIDRNGDKVIDTSRDRNGDGQIETDCNGDGLPDSLATVCTGAFAGTPPEFVGDDDECILFTVNYGDSNDFGRSVCLDRGIDFGASNAWVGTHNHNAPVAASNRFYKIDGTSGALSGPYDLPAGHRSYGCVVDSQGILWSVHTGGNLTYLNTVNPTMVGPLASPPAAWGAAFYGIGLDDKSHVWLAGWNSPRIYRLKPDRSSFANLASGTWTGIARPTILDPHTRGIAADGRGKIWIASTSGYVWRVDQSIGDGLHDLTADTNYWATGTSGVIGVGLDFAGHVWAISYGNHKASRLDVDNLGDPIQPPTLLSNTVGVGKNPYTYSDFTGYGLQNFTRPQGRYLYQLEPCPPGIPAQWEQVSWVSTTPPGTSIAVRVRAGDTESTLGDWYGPYFQSPARLGAQAADPLVPNPAAILQVELTLKTNNKDISPILHDFSVGYSCSRAPE